MLQPRRCRHLPSVVLLGFVGLGTFHSRVTAVRNKSKVLDMLMFLEVPEQRSNQCRFEYRRSQPVVHKTAKEAVGTDQFEAMDWELISEQIARHVEESLPRDCRLSAITPEESCAIQRSTTADTPPTASEKPILGDSNPCRYHTYRCIQCTEKFEPAEVSKHWLTSPGSRCFQFVSSTLR